LLNKEFTAEGVSSLRLHWNWMISLIQVLELLCAWNTLPDVNIASRRCATPADQTDPPLDG
jgi:hypothetical protein